MGTINSSMQAVQQAQADLGHVDNLPPLGHDLVSLLHILKKHFIMDVCFLMLHPLLLQIKGRLNRIKHLHHIKVHHFSPI